MFYFYLLTDQGKIQIFRKFTSVFEKSTDNPFKTNVRHGLHALFAEGGPCAA